MLRICLSYVSATMNYMCLQTENQQRMRDAAVAGMQRLPPGITSQQAPQPAGVCHVCFTEDYTDDNLLLEVLLYHQ